MSSAVLAMVVLLTAASTTRPSPDPRYEIDQLLFRDDFTKGTTSWSVELEHGGTVAARDGALTIDVPAGCTVWLKQPIDGPAMIEYDAKVVGAGGANDRVSDLNCFWMARDARTPQDLFATKHSGAFADYDQLKTYYVGLGGNNNTTTRFRRYIGEKDNRPLLPEHDLRDNEHLIVANAAQTIRLVACGKLIQYLRNDQRLFDRSAAVHQRMVRVSHRC